LKKIILSILSVLIIFSCSLPGNNIAFNNMGLSFNTDPAEWSAVPDNDASINQMDYYSLIGTNIIKSIKISEHQLKKLLINYKNDLLVYGAVYDFKDDLKPENITKIFEDIKKNEDSKKNTEFTKITLEKNKSNIQGYKLLITYTKDNKKSSFYYFIIPVNDNKQFIMLYIKNIIYNDIAEKKILQLINSINIIKKKDVYNRIIQDHFIINDLDASYNLNIDRVYGCFTISKDENIIRIFTSPADLGSKKLDEIHNKLRENYKSGSLNETIKRFNKHGIYYIIDSQYKNKDDLKTINKIAGMIKPKLFASVIYKPIRNRLLSLYNNNQNAEYYKNISKNITAYSKMSYIKSNSYKFAHGSFFKDNPVIIRSRYSFYEKKEDCLVVANIEKTFIKNMMPSIRLIYDYIYKDHKYRGFFLSYSIQPEYTETKDLEESLYTYQSLIDDFFKEKKDSFIFNKTNYSFLIEIINKGDKTFKLKISSCQKGDCADKKNFDKNNFEEVETDLKGKINTIKFISIKNKKETVNSELTAIDKKLYDEEIKKIFDKI